MHTKRTIRLVYAGCCRRAATCLLYLQVTFRDCHHLPPFRGFPRTIFSAITRCIQSEEMLSGLHNICKISINCRNPRPTSKFPSAFEHSTRKTPPSLCTRVLGRILDTHACGLREIEAYILSLRHMGDVPQRNDLVCRVLQDLHIVLCSLLLFTGSSSADMFDYEGLLGSLNLRRYYDASQA